MDWDYPELEDAIYASGYDVYNHKKTKHCLVKVLDEFFNSDSGITEYNILGPTNIRGMRVCQVRLWDEDGYTTVYVA